MGVKKEIVTSCRVEVVFYRSAIIPGEHQGLVIDTADYENGLFFCFYAGLFGTGPATLKITHSDDDTTGFVDVKKENLVYGRSDGNLPVISPGISSGNYIAREGVVGTRRYVKVAVINQGGDNMTDVVVLATQMAESTPVDSDAIYS